jgi:glucose 1-dehydrogenase
MRAVAVFPQTREIRIVDESEPSLPGATGVKLRMLEVGICGTDREIASFRYGTPPPGSDHLVVGHESLARVVEVGSSVSRVRVGNLAVIMVRRPCPDAGCLPCRNGRQDFCMSGAYTERGIQGASGFMTEVVADDEAYVIPVPEAIRDAAVLVEPLTIAEKALEQVRQVQARLPWGWPPAPGKPLVPHRAVVVGAGPVGLLGAMALVLSGFETHVYSREGNDDPRAALARSIGAAYVSSLDVPLDRFAAGVGNIDLVYEATGAAQFSFDVLERLGANGVFVFTGVPGRKGTITIDGDRILRDMVLRNQVAFGSVNAPRIAYEAAARDLGHFRTRWPDALRSLITGRYAMEDYGALLTGRTPGIKRVMTMGPAMA